MVAPLTSDPVVESNCHVVSSGSVGDPSFVGGPHLSPLVGLPSLSVTLPVGILVLWSLMSSSASL